MTPTRQVLFIQGGGAGAHDDWDGELVQSLRWELGNGYEVRYPRWPGSEFELPGDLGARLPPGARVHVFHGL
jgi:hypothetical protein